MNLNAGEKEQLSHLLLAGEKAVSVDFAGPYFYGAWSILRCSVSHLNVDLASFQSLTNKKVTVTLRGGATYRVGCFEISFDHLLVFFFFIVIRVTVEHLLCISDLLSLSHGFLAETAHDLLIVHIAC